MNGKRFSKTAMRNKKHVHFVDSNERPIAQTSSLDSIKFGMIGNVRKNKNKKVPAGGLVTNLDDLRKITSGNCKELEEYVTDVKGRIPIFGYPMISYSPPDTGRTLTDRKTWRIAMLSGG